MKAATATGISLQLRRVFDAPRERVFAAWTEREWLERWMCRDVAGQVAQYIELDVRPGGRYVIEIPIAAGGMYRGQGVFREVTPPEKLVFTWVWSRIPEKPGVLLQREDSLVTVELYERDGQTEMVFTHELFENEAVREEHRAGWQGCFDVLEKELIRG